MCCPAGSLSQEINLSLVLVLQGSDVPALLESLEKILQAATMLCMDRSLAFRGYLWAEIRKAKAGGGEGREKNS